jgi:hypothetical protein
VRSSDRRTAPRTARAGPPPRSYGEGVDAGDVAAAVAACRAALGPAVGADWTVPADELDMSVAEVVAHLATVLLWYSADLAAGPEELSTTDVRVRPECPPAALLATVGAHGAVLAAVIAASPPRARGWHPWGIADASGFAAMACDELLVHTDDAARGLGVPFAPDAGLAARTLHRLFPEAPADSDPWATLRWANGRATLGDRPRLVRWRWHCGPLPAAAADRPKP